MSYQPSTPFLASQFCDDLQAFARELHPSAADEEKGFLQDVARGRYPMVALQRLMAVAARSDRPEHREFLAEVVRRECGVVAAGCVASAFDRETESTGAADLAQRSFERAPCRSTGQRVRDALIRQLSTTRHALDVVLGHDVWQ